MALPRRVFVTSCLTLAACGRARAAQPYTVIRAGDGRDVRVSTWLPTGAQKGVILFSHGAMSAPAKYQRLLGPWAAAGFKILAPLHVDSTDHPDHARYGMIDSWRCRLLDMRALATFAAVEHFIAAGHSYGALMALTLGGASPTRPAGFTGPLSDDRTSSVIAFSPPGLAPGLVPAGTYASLAKPALVQTGTQDVPFGAKDGRWQVHLEAFDEAPPGNTYALVLDGANHYFGGIICRPELPGPPQTDAFANALSISLEFLSGFGANDTAARAALNAALTDEFPAKLTRKTG